MAKATQTLIGAWSGQGRGRGWEDPRLQGVDGPLT